MTNQPTMTAARFHEIVEKLDFTKRGVSHFLGVNGALDRARSHRAAGRYGAQIDYGCRVLFLLDTASGLTNLDC